MNLYNAEGYIDLTAYEALSRIEREERRAKKAAAYRPLVYICSPYSHGCINDNIENARRYSRFAVDTHYVPIAPHLLFPQFMDDGLGEDRQTAMFMNLVSVENVLTCIRILISSLMHRGYDGVQEK